MTATELSLLITAITAPLTGLFVAVWKAVNIAINREVIRRQAISTVETKNAEIDELKQDVTERDAAIQELRQEKRQLWAMLGRAPQ
ncbi:MAG: hypothetical protein M3439_05250 [Chloroflexota bacterium]|nr:hypothetical protein [Chloroflexota bacterium]